MRLAYLPVYEFESKQLLDTVIDIDSVASAQVDTDIETEKRLIRIQGSTMLDYWLEMSLPDFVELWNDKSGRDLLLETKLRFG